MGTPREPIRPAEVPPARSCGPARLAVSGEERPEQIGGFPFAPASGGKVWRRCLARGQTVLDPEAIGGATISTGSPAVDFELHLAKS